MFAIYMEWLTLFFVGTVTCFVNISKSVFAVVDYFLRHVQFRAIEITGFVLITIGFFLTLLPINWTQNVRKRLPCKSLRKDPEEEASKNHYVHTPRDLLRMSMAAAKKKQPTWTFYSAFCTLGTLQPWCFDTFTWPKWCVEWNSDHNTFLNGLFLSFWQRVVKVSGGFA